MGHRLKNAKQYLYFWYLPSIHCTMCSLVYRFLFYLEDSKLMLTLWCSLMTSVVCLIHLQCPFLTFSSVGNCFVRCHCRSLLMMSGQWFWRILYGQLYTNTCTTLMMVVILSSVHPRRRMWKSDLGTSIFRVNV